MIQQLLKSMVLSGVVSSSALAEGSESFDLPGYLSACTGRVHDAIYGIPMDTLCLNTGRDLCNPRADMQDLDACVAQEVRWMQRDLNRIKAEFPQTTADLTRDDGSALFTMGAEAPHCREIKDSNLSAETACAYEDALGEWLRARTLERSYRLRQ